MRPCFELTTPPAIEPVTLSEAKAHARVEHSADDALFGRLIAAARRYVEHATGLALIHQTWTATWPAWPGRAAGLPLRPHPVAAITGVTVGGVASAAFALRRGRPAHAILVSGQPAPPAGAEIVITFQAGFGANAANVPDDLKQAMLFLIAHWYENREPTAAAMSLSVVGDIKFTVDALLAPHRSMRLA